MKLLNEMRLFKIEMYNFRQFYGKKEIYFPSEGLIAIRGRNGSGKSTLFNALGWCLYGKVKDIKKEDIPNDTVNPKHEPCYVEITLSFNGHLYVIRRDFKKTDECFITADSEVYAVGNSNVTSFVEENLFKMNHEMFRSCFYAEQDDFDNLVKSTPGHRIKTISKLLRIETIDKAAEKARADARESKAALEEARRVLKDEPSLMQQKNTLKSEKKNVQSLIEKSDSDIEFYRKEYLSQKEELNRLEVDEKEFNRLSHKKKECLSQAKLIEENQVNPSRNKLLSIEKAEKFIANNGEEIKNIKNLSDRKEALNDLRYKNSEKVNKENSLAEVKRKITEYKEYEIKGKQGIENLEGSQEEADSILKEARKVKEDREAINNKLQQIKFTFDNKKELYKDYDDMKKQFEEMGKETPCPTCQRPLQEHYDDKLEDIKEKMSKIKSEVKELKEEYDFLRSDYDNKTDLLKTHEESHRKATENLHKLNKIENNLSLLRNSLKDFVDQERSLEKEISSIGPVSYSEDEHKKVIEELKRLQPIESKYQESLNLVTNEKENVKKQITDGESEISRLKKEATSISEQISKLNFDENKLEEVKSSFYSSQDKLYSTKEQRAKLDSDLKSLTSNISNVDEQLKELHDRKKEIATKEKDLVLLNKLDESYKQYKTDILSILAPTLSQIMSDNIEDITNGRYDHVELDSEKYDIYIYRNGQKKHLDSFSGGERKLIALTQRLAISELLIDQSESKGTFDLLALDEVFGSLDEERVDSLIESLRQLNNKFSQILVVTHSEQVREMFDHTLEIFIDENGGSDFQWITPFDENETKEELLEYVEKIS